MLSRNAIAYTLQHLTQVSFPDIERHEVTFTANGETLHIAISEQWHIIIKLMSDSDIQALYKGALAPLLFLSADGRVQVPLFRPSKADGETISQDIGRNELQIPFDLITISFLLLSKRDEPADALRDRHDRFPFRRSLPDLYRFIHIPLADEYAMLLRKWIIEAFRPSIKPAHRRYRFIPTHDIDLLYRFRNPIQAAKSILGRDLLLDRSLSCAAASWKEYRQWRNDARHDPYITAIIEFAHLSKMYGLQSVFFFRSDSHADPGAAYDVRDPNVRYCIDAVREAGMDIGLHGSYESYTRKDRLCREKEALETAAGQRITNVRQHYLRFRLEAEGEGNSTLDAWRAAGLTDDYTLGYAEQPGFRCGTCHPYRLYDNEADRPTGITEHPLIVMDGSLVDYRHLSPAEGNRLTSLLRQRCEAVEGDFIILWHNHFCSRQYRTYYNQIYLEQLKGSNCPET